MTAVDRGNRLLRSCFTRAGKPKRTYPSQSDAKEANKRNRTSLHAYECEFCNGWHLGGGRRQ